MDLPHNIEIIVKYGDFYNNKIMSKIYKINTNLNNNENENIIAIDEYFEDIGGDEYLTEVQIEIKLNDNSIFVSDLKEDKYYEIIDDLSSGYPKTYYNNIYKQIPNSKNIIDGIEVITRSYYKGISEEDKKLFYIETIEFNIDYFC